MTGYTVHTGASKKFVSGWDKVFADKAGTKSEKKSEGKKGKVSGSKKKKK
jgi:hypothetical protein